MKKRRSFSPDYRWIGMRIGSAWPNKIILSTSPRCSIRFGGGSESPAADCARASSCGLVLGHGREGCLRVYESYISETARTTEEATATLGALACIARQANRMRLLNWSIDDVKPDAMRKPKLLVALLLGKVAGELLARLRPAAPAPSDAVFLGRRGAPIHSVREAFDKAVLAVWTPGRPGERKPCFHDLRATVGTRVEAVSSYATVKLLLGHSTAGDVTGGYIRPSLDSVRDALNRAARSIDGEAPEGAIPFRSRVREAPEMARQTAHPANSDAVSAR